MTAYELRVSDWSSDVCSADLVLDTARLRTNGLRIERHQLQNFLRHVGADGKAEFLSRRRRDRVVVRPSPARHLLRERIRQIVKIGRESCRERVCQYV